MQVQDGPSDAQAPPAGDDRSLPRLDRAQVTPHTVIVVILSAVAVLGLLYLLWVLRAIVRWGLIAIFLAAALDPAVDYLARHRLKRGIASLIVLAVLLTVAIGLVALLVPPLVAQVHQLANDVIGLTQRPGGINQALQDFAAQHGLSVYLDTLRSQLSGLPNHLGAYAGSLVTLTRSIVSSLTAMLSILVLTYFLLLDGERFATAGLLLVPEEQRPRLRRVAYASAGAIRGYVNGNVAISVICGIGAYIALTILGIPFALALALFVAVTDLIPMVGATIGAAVVVGVAFLVDPIKAVILVGYIVVYQQVENNVLQPLVYSRSVHLHALVVFLAILVGGELLGILGALLAIPVAEIIRIIGAEWLANRAEATSSETDEMAEAASTDQLAADLRASNPS